jgi:2-hydroxychromene-2-carboxylate isomerase
MSTPEQVAEAAAPLGIAAADLLAAVTDPAIKERLKAETERSLARGVFGSPFVIVDGEPFWGNDRLDEVERWLATGGW